MQPESQTNDCFSPQKANIRRKALSDRPIRKDERVLWRHRGINQPVPEMITYLLMKQKFQKMYKKIEKLTSKDEEMIHNFHQNVDKQTLLESSVKIIHLFERDQQPQVCKIKTSQLYPKHSLPIKGELQINNAHTTNEVDQSSVGKVSPIKLAQILRKTRYQKKMLQPIKNKLSNNIKDYLSVEKIAIKEMNDPLGLQKSKMQRQYNISNLLALKTKDQNDLDSKLKRYQSTQLRQDNTGKVENFIMKRNLKFKAPFQLYNYRDFMWQVAYSNGVVVEPIEEYETKIKFYVGPGNNSNLIKGIMKRRPWYALTDKPQDASFVWTQIKVMSYFGLQAKRQRLPHINEEEMQSYQSQSKEANNQNQTKKKEKEKENTLLNHIQQSKWQQYWKVNIERERKIKEHLKGRSKYFNINQTNISKIRAEVKIHNHFPNNFIIGNKKALFKTMSEYYSSSNKDVFQFLPLTFHIKNGLEDDEYLKFLQYFYALNKAAKNDENCINKFNAWIVKPGENTNRGNGIIVCLQLNEIKNILKKQEKHADGSLKTYILQKYIERPLLYKKRKFDLRHYMMLNCAHGRMKGYWYREGYVRTTSTEYTLKISNGSVHLTNDAVQKNLPDYGKYEKGNKIYYEQLDHYIKKQDPNFDFFKLIYPRMKQIATDVIHASALNIDPQRRVNNFQIFGLDFMIDSNYNVWLIEVNTNPCLETACPVLNKIIPKFVENAFQICLDPVFPAPLGFAPKYNSYLQNLKEENKFQLVFDQRIDGARSIGESVLATGVEQQDDVFDDDGEDFDQAN